MKGRAGTVSASEQDIVKTGIRKSRTRTRVRDLFLSDLYRSQMEAAARSYALRRLLRGSQRRFRKGGKQIVRSCEMRLKVKESKMLNVICLAEPYNSHQNSKENKNK